MTINEAIAYHKKEADECKNLILKEKYLVPQESYYCLRLKENVEIHEQQAEWLEELKTRRETHFDYVSLMDKRYYEGYNKAIDDFAERIALEISESIIWGILVNSDKDNSFSDTTDKIVDYVIDTSKEIAEQLKKGGAE